MNKCYKTIWNEALGAWVAASENDAARGKPSKSKVAAAVALGALAFSGGGAFLSEAQAYTFPGVCASAPNSVSAFFTASSSISSGTGNACNTDAPIVGTAGGSAGSNYFVYMTANGTQVEVNGDTGLIYFRAGGTSGNVLTMTNVAGAGPTGGVLLSGVAAGAISAASTQAVNGSQLYTLSTSASTGISTAQSGVTSLSTGLSTTNSSLASLSTSASTGLSSANSSISSLSTSASTGISS
ncbi:ESPR-type extended signal peptide-containing protein, partial [Burkholderia stagnalis]|uniref:ESPR-type extended signal peptide-containing protein n=1 Tax=Burkholderia stagnalis TaxID=1503054 RepID=UPI0039BFC153